jgi:hypothetical protein
MIRRRKGLIEWMGVKARDLGKSIGWFDSRSVLIPVRFSQNWAAKENGVDI